ncbi:NXPE family member 4-like [Anomaloglossus baeobatrachus]|uniref:NXPE family member 4-like n=1 Tax=Anomaloglossus baeobatrachus TaxID=238106 RepID=UPI003F50537B
MFKSNLKQFKIILGFTVLFITLLSFILHFQLKTTCTQHKKPGRHQVNHLSVVTSTSSEDELKSAEMFYMISTLIPNLTLNDLDKTSNASRSRASIIHPKQKYCVGDTIIVQVDMLDNLSNRKSYGGDFMKVRISTPNLKAAASGKVVDFNNGTYHVYFTLFWEGRVYISIALYHPSEAVAALWRARNKDYGLVYFIGTFVNGGQQVKSECGFQLDSDKNICEYGNHEIFYCYKPDSLSCGSLSFLQYFNRNLSFLNPLENILFKRENIAMEIPPNPDYVDVQKCTTSSPLALEQCKVGMESPFPSGFVLQNIWKPVFCSISNFTTQEQRYNCLSDKMIYFMGDSTVRQWFTYLVQNFTDLKTFDLHREGLDTLLVAMDQKRNIHLQWKMHSHPIVSSQIYTVKDEAYVHEQIDRLAGGSHYVIVICLGQHFRLFPVQLFIRRVIHVQKALIRLFLRSPDTKVIIKNENTRNDGLDSERFSDFHAYINNLILKDIFRNLPVAVVDAWDMTVAHNTHDVHPPELVVKSQIDLFLTYICS